MNNTALFAGVPCLGVVDLEDSRERIHVRGRYISSGLTPVAVLACLNAHGQVFHSVEVGPAYHSTRHGFMIVVLLVLVADPVS